MPPPPVLTQRQEYIVLSPDLRTPTQYDLTIVHHAWRAERVRAHVATHGLADYEAEHLAILRALYQAATLLAPARVVDEPDQGRIRLDLRFDLPKAWRVSDDGARAQFKTSDDALLREAPMPRVIAPIELGEPRTILYATVVDLPFAMDGSGWDDGAQAEGLRATSKLTLEGQRLTLLRELTITAPTVPADKAGEFFDLRDWTVNQTGLSLTFQVVDNIVQPPAG